MSYSFDEFFDSLATLAVFEGSNEPELINPIYKATIDKLAALLDANQIPYTRSQIWDGEQLRFPWCEGDVICHSGSYGSNNSKVESMGFPWDEDDVTKLSVESAYTLISTYHDFIQVINLVREREP